MVLTVQPSPSAGGDMQAEALFKEARRRRRRRRVGTALVILALATTGIVVGVTSGHRSPTGPPSGSPRLVAIARARGELLIRPVLCYAPPYSPSTSATTNALPTACAAKYQLVTTNISVKASSGLSYNVSEDPTLAPFPTTSPTQDLSHQGATVLLGGPRGAGRQRYLLGAAVLSGRIIESARAELTPAGAWVVVFQLSRSGASAWDVVAQRYFHEVMAFEFRGVVESAPLIEPNTATFRSFDGSIQVWGSFTKAAATALAANFSP